MVDFPRIAWKSDRGGRAQCPSPPKDTTWVGDEPRQPHAVDRPVGAPAGSLDPENQPVRPILSHMSTDVTEADFQHAVVDRSREVPVVVDFWADWCGPCKALTPALERAAEARAGKVELVKVDVDGNPGLSRQFGVQGIPAVKAFKDGQVVDEFVGAQPAAMVERFMDKLVPTEADALVAEGDEQSLRCALELEPGRADAATTLARMLIDRGELDEALALLDGVSGDFTAEGLAALVKLRLDHEDGPLAEGADALLSGDPETGLERLIGALEQAEDDDTRDQIRKAMVGVFSERGADDPLVRDYRRKLAAALY